MIFPAVFAIIVGLGMIGLWSMLLLAKQAPELETEPLRIRPQTVSFLPASGQEIQPPSR